MHFPFDGSVNENFNSTTVNARNPQYGQDRNGQTNKAYYFPGNNTSYISGDMPELLDETRELNFKEIIWNSSYLWLAIIGLVLFFHKRK